MNEDSFASYLAKHYIGRKGFQPGTVPEAEPLAQVCDIVLTQADGMSFQVVCIVDREKNPQKTFAMPLEALLEIGQRCLKYTGKVSGQQMPVTLQIVEVGRGPGSPQDRQRLAALKRKSAFGKVVPIAWRLDTTAGRAWTNAPFGGLLMGKRAMEDLMRGPRLADKDLQAPQLAVGRERFPALTIALLAVLAAVFGAELYHGIGEWSGPLAPSIQTLVAFGGLYKPAVLDGEWHRLFTSTLLHGDILHLVFNGVALYMAGMVLESLVGRRWYFTLFVLGGLGGSLMSLAVNPPTVVSVGASGAIMGLCGAALVCSFRYPSGPARTQIQMAMMQVLIPALIPIATTRTGGHIDFGAHLGGAVTGLVLGFAMLRTWKPDQERPALLPVATLVCVAAVTAFGLSALRVVRDHHGYTLDAVLIPSRELPASNAEAKDKAPSLAKRFPRDPRARLYLASALLDAKDLPGAERELRAGLAENEILKTKFKPELEARMRALLALVLDDQGKTAEAKSEAQSTCGISAPALAQMRELLVQQRLCDK